MILKGDNMKVVITGGGTGGHIYPAVAIIEELKKRDEKIEILYIGTKNSMESELIPSLNIDYKSIEVMGLPRKINLKLFKSVFVLLKGLSQAKKILKEFKPDVVIGTGGFVTGPVLYKAHKLGIYTIFHEQNSYPGITNRILSKYVDAMAVTFKESIKFFKNNEKCVVTGNPIRNRFEVLDRESSLEFFGLDKNTKNIFSFGGSNGSEELNKAVIGILDNNIENLVGKKYDEYYFIDPNTGNIHDSPFLDYAKLLQSLHGNYEFLMNVSEIKIEKNYINFMVTESDAYVQLYQKYYSYLKEKFSNRDIISIFFHEIIHWLRLLPYKIKKNDKLAVVFYTKLLKIIADVQEIENDLKK